jgi:hypothetical protein
MTTYHSIADVTRQVQYVEEATFGTTPTNPTLINAGGVLSITDSTEMTAKRYRVLGSEDIYRGLLCGELYSFEVTYNPSTTTFLRYGTEIVGGGAGSIDKSLTIVTGFKIAGVENFLIFRGCKTDKIEIEVTPDDMVVTQNFICQSISTPSTAHGLGASTVFAAAFSGTPLCAPDTGTNPLTINSLTYDCIRFDITWARNLDARQVIGKSQVLTIVPTVRDIDIEFDLLLKDTVTWADVKTLSARTASFVLNQTGPKTISMTNLQLEKLDFELSTDSTEVLMASFAGFAATASVTA